MLANEEDLNPRVALFEPKEPFPNLDCQRRRDEPPDRKLSSCVLSSNLPPGRDPQTVKTEQGVELKKLKLLIDYNQNLDKQYDD